MFDRAAQSWSRWPSRSFRSCSQARVTSSTIPKRSGTRSSQPRGRRSRKAGITASDLAAVGITNQRETTVLWERDSGRPIANAIVWQSRVTAPICDRLKAAGHEATLSTARPGSWSMPIFPGRRSSTCSTRTTACARARRAGEILFGTIDSFLVWRLTRGRAHITDVSNASRTLLFNLHTLEWDDELLRILDVPRAMLPEVRSSSEVYGETDPALLGSAIPIAGIAGDQQAALFGQACFEPGAAKNTYGTGCFMLLNTGETPVPSHKGLLTTVAWKLGETGRRMRSKARCSSRAPPCSGCATGSRRSRHRRMSKS